MTQTFCQQILKSKSENFGWALNLDSGRQILCRTGECWKLYTIFYSKLAEQSIMACTRTISTTSTFYYYLLLSTLPIPVRPGERSAKRRSGSSSTSSSGWSRWQLCYNATMLPNNYVIVPPCIFMKWVLHFLKTSELHILFYSLLLSGVMAISAFCKEQQQCIAIWLSEIFPH